MNYFKIYIQWRAKNPYIFGTDVMQISKTYIEFLAFSFYLFIYLKKGIERRGNAHKFIDFKMHCFIYGKFCYTFACLKNHEIFSLKNGSNIFFRNNV